MRHPRNRLSKPTTAFHQSIDAKLKEGYRVVDYVRTGPIASRGTVMSDPDGTKFIVLWDGSVQFYNREG